MTKIYKNKTFFQLIKFVTYFHLCLTIGAVVVFNSPSKFEIYIEASGPSSIESQKANLAKSLSSLNNDLEDVQQLSSTLQGEIQRNQDEITRTSKAIDEATSLITNLKIEIDKNQSDLNELTKQMKSLLIELQKQEEISPIETVLSSKNLADMIGNFYNISMLQSKANDLREKIEEKNTLLADQVKDTETTKKQLEDTKFTLASKNSSLEDLRNQTKNEESKYQQIRRSLISQANAISAKEQESRSQAASQVASSSNSINPPKTTKVSCWFEENTVLDIPSGYLSSPTTGHLEQIFNGCRHDGADISNALNTELRATANATVVRKGYDGGGYGNYVVLKIVLPSGQRIYTLYAHMNSSSPKSVGDSVNKGELVGYMGRTGLATGVHLHFMIYSDTYESTGLGCRLGKSKCYNPSNFIGF